MSTIFKQSDIRGKYPEEINEKVIGKIAKVLVVYFKAQKVAIGYDTRESSKTLSRAFINAVLSQGADILDFGVISTGIFFFAQNKYKPDLFVQITASHVGKNFNGLKLLNKSGMPIYGAELKEAEQRMNNIPKQHNTGAGTLKRINVLNDYLDWLIRQINLDQLKPLKIVLDPSNGPIAPTLSNLCSAIPCEPIKLNFGVKDRFKDHALDPLKRKSHKDVQKLVKKHKADLGVIWDGDGDRIVFFDDKAEFVHPYYITMLLVKIILKQNKGRVILHDDRLKLGLNKAIAGRGKILKIIKAGWPNFIKAMKEQKAVFGAETSAHYYINSPFPTADGILPLLLILEYLSENNISLSGAVAEFREKYFVMPEMNFHNIDFVKARGKLQKHYSEKNQSLLDGISITSKHWHINLRESETEQELTRLNLEADSKELFKSKKQEVLKLLHC